jgi:hypothetical protein
MERLIFRSLSAAHLEAELRQREFRAEARRDALARSALRARRTGFWLRLPGLRLLDRSRAEGRPRRREKASNPI